MPSLTASVYVILICFGHKSYFADTIINFVVHDVFSTWWLPFKDNDVKFETPKNERIGNGPCKKYWNYLSQKAKKKY